MCVCAATPAPPSPAALHAAGKHVASSSPWSKRHKGHGRRSAPNAIVAAGELETFKGAANLSSAAFQQLFY